MDEGKAFADASRGVPPGAPMGTARSAARTPNRESRRLKTRDLERATSLRDGFILQPAQAMIKGGSGMASMPWYGFVHRSGLPCDTGFQPVRENSADAMPRARCSTRFQPVSDNVTYTICCNPRSRFGLIWLSTRRVVGRGEDCENFEMIRRFRPSLGLDRTSELPSA
jgi:hypothetical protein